MVRCLEEFKNKHQGEDIYVIASGKSCDFISPDFFSNKITIGLNQVYKKFNTTYLVRKEYKLIDEIISKNPQIIHFISYSTSGNHSIDKRKHKNKNYIEEKYSDNNNIVLFDHNDNKHKVEHLPNNENRLLVSYSTITTAMHLGAYMGAKNIILVGHDCGLINGKSNFANYHSDETIKISWDNKKQYDHWISNNIEKGSIRTKKLLKEKYGCNIYSLNPFINFGLEGNKYTRVKMH